MGEVRKRKASAEGEQAKSPENVVVQKNGMGFFSVVFVAAILAGSGCQVLKKDQAVEFDAVRGLAAQLKADNVKTLATIATMQEGVEAKDTIIKRLQEEVTATHEKNALLKEELKLLNELIETTESSLKANIEANYQDQFEELKAQAKKYGKVEKDLLKAGNSVEELEEKLSDLQETVRKSSDDNDARSKSITDLQSELDLAKTETASKLIQLHELVSISGVDVEKIDGQAAEIVKVQHTLAVLESKLNEESLKIVELAENDVTSDISALESSIQAQKTAVENLIGALANAAKAEDVAKISALTKEIQQAIVNVEESKVSKNAVGPLRNEFETAITQLQKTVNDIAESAKSSDAKFTTELAALSSVLESLKNAPESKTEP
ncbi:unnamed protein product [Oikopleura dioica]|uniref:Uncharacterized protein n=1 Tax=Oikopleura dioica TaxID=34765 RepID=E4X1Q3_OIKDI|nr:unnamed protein product [Oikopleura dioica]